jgi:hypothetical protein
MGERQNPTKGAPPAVSSEGLSFTGPDDVEATAFSAPPAPGLFAEYWPPSGWPMFACVTRPSGTVTGLERDALGNLNLLKYQVRIDPAGIYTIEILKGALKSSGQVSLQPALNIRFTGLEDWFEDNLEKAVLDIDVEGVALTPRRDVILRLILAMTFLISRIDRGLMPNLKKTLKIYRLG